MRRALLFAAALGALSCAPKTPSSNPIPAHLPGAAPAPSPPPAPPPTPPPTQAIRLGPSALRYAMHQVVHIDQDFQGMHQPLAFGLSAFFRVTITGPADTAGYPT